MMEFIVTKLKGHSHTFSLALLKSPRFSGGVSFLLRQQVAVLLTMYPANKKCSVLATETRKGVN